VLFHKLTSSTARNQKLKKWGKEKVKKNGYVQKYRQTGRGIHGVSPEEEKEGNGGKVLSLG